MGGAGAKAPAAPYGGGGTGTGTAAEAKEEAAAGIAKEGTGAGRVVVIGIRATRLMVSLLSQDSAAPQPYLPIHKSIHPSIIISIFLRHRTRIYSKMCIHILYIYSNMNIAVVYIFITRLSGYEDTHAHARIRTPHTQQKVHHIPCIHIIYIHSLGIYVIIRILHVQRTYFPRTAPAFCKSSLLARS